AATLNLAAMAAQGARVWEKLDPGFSARCLHAAETALEAAKKNPAVRSDTLAIKGGGAYGDGDIADELYWAATELFITTGKPAYKEEMIHSRFHAPKSGAPAI